MQFVHAVAIPAAVVKAVNVDALHKVRGGVASFVLAALGDDGRGAGDGLHVVADGEGKSGCRYWHLSGNDSGLGSGG